MPRPALPADWTSPLHRTSLIPKMTAGVPMEVLFASIWAAAEIGIALDAKPQAVIGFLVVYLPSRYFTWIDPWWLELLRERVALWISRAVATRGRSIRLSPYKAPR